VGRIEDYRADVDLDRLRVVEHEPPQRGDPLGAGPARLEGGGCVPAPGGEGDQNRPGEQADPSPPVRLHAMLPYPSGCRGNDAWGAWSVMSASRPAGQTRRGAALARPCARA